MAGILNYCLFHLQQNSSNVTENYVRTIFKFEHSNQIKSLIKDISLECEDKVFIKSYSQDNIKR